jgi:hypothetical protein
MKPASFAKLLEAQAAVAAIGGSGGGGGGGGEVAAQLRALAAFFADQKAASVGAALKAAPSSGSRPRHLAALIDVLDHTADAFRAQSATSAAIKDIAAVRAALGVEGMALADIIAGWHASKPAAKAGRSRAGTGRSKPPSKPAADTGKLIEEYAGALRGARYDEALAVIDGIAADKRLTAPHLRALLAAVHDREAPGKAPKKALIEMLKRPFLDDRIDADKTRAIRAGGAL